MLKNRITTKNQDGTIGIGEPLKYYNYQDIVRVLVRLFDYENTGLEPDEISLFVQILKQIMGATDSLTYDELIDKIKDGRVFVIRKDIKDCLSEAGLWDL